MRPLLKYGIPAAAGLATGGYALSQGEDPGSAALAGVGGVLGGAAGLLGARLAGKYMAPHLGSAIHKGSTPILGAVLEELEKGPEGGLRQKTASAINTKLEALMGNQQVMAAMAGQTQGTPFERTIQKGITGLAVPAAAGLAGLGGVALGAIPGSMGVPGFTDQRIDPESYGSSNSPGARYKQTTGTAGISNYQR